MGENKARVLIDLSISHSNKNIQSTINTRAFNNLCVQYSVLIILFRGSVNFDHASKND